MGMARLTGASALSRLVAFLSLLLLAPIYGRAEHLPVKTYTTVDGLPRDTASCISSDSHGLHGLENTQRRVRQLRGTLTIESSPGQGTRLKLTIPLKPHTI
jgi:hypothetical protein